MCAVEQIVAPEPRPRPCHQRRLVYSQLRVTGRGPVNSDVTPGWLSGTSRALGAATV